MWGHTSAGCLRLTFLYSSGKLRKGVDELRSFRETWVVNRSFEVDYDLGINKDCILLI